MPSVYRLMNVLQDLKFNSPVIINLSEVLKNTTDNLNKQNKLMMEWLKRSKKSIQSKTLIQKIEECESSKLPDIKISTLDHFNQKLRQIFVEAQEDLEGSKDSEHLKKSWIVLREMHGHRKVSHMLDLLQSGD